MRFAAATAAVAFLLAGGPATLVQAQHQRPRHKDDLKHQVEKLEEAWRTAQLNDDAETMNRLLSDNYIGITMNGQIVTKMQQLDRMRTRTMSLSRIDLDDVKVKLIGQTAVVTSRANVEGTDEGEPFHGIYRYTRVYARVANGSWKITNFEVTRVGATSPGGRSIRTEDGAAADGSGLPRKIAASRDGGTR
jgi:ketosteroid isomerase-like protein